MGVNFIKQQNANLKWKINEKISKQLVKDK